MSPNLKLVEIGEVVDQVKLTEELSQQGVNIAWSEVSQESEMTLEERARACDAVIVNGPQSLEMYKVINYRSVGSHFLDYIDLIENRAGKLWGHSLYSEVFFDCLLQAVRNQDYKGSVIFLGEHPRVLPMLEVLAKFGFKDFDFLNLSNERPVFDHVQTKIQGFLDTQVSSVESAAFVRSQKEYSLCFVLFDQYSPQILEDMSYFHFLSTNSMVFDFSGQSNFLFKEVRALGVDVFDFAQIQEVYRSKLVAKLLQIANKTS